MSEAASNRKIQGRGNRALAVIGAAIAFPGVYFGLPALLLSVDQKVYGDVPTCEVLADAGYDCSDEGADAYSKQQMDGRIDMVRQSLWLVVAGGLTIEVAFIRSDSHVASDYYPENFFSDVT